VRTTRWRTGMAPESATGSMTLRVRVAVAIAATLAAVQFLAPWWNRHLGLSLDGYMPWFGHRILHGEMPYRDFFLHLPPLHPLAEALLEATAGKSIFAGRVVGAIVHVLLAVVLALWLSRSFRPWLSIFASVAALTVATSDGVEILDLYNPYAALAALASGYFACLGMSSGSARSRFWSGLSGVSAGLAFWTKQTVGLGATVAVPVALALLTLRDPEFRGRGRRLAAGFALGWLVVAVPIVIWLFANEAFEPFIRQVFSDAAGSKGSPFLLLRRPWSGPLDMPNELRDSGIVAVVLAITALAVSRNPPAAVPSAKRPIPSIVGGWSVASLALLVGGWIATRMIAIPGGARRELMHGLTQARWLIIMFAMYAITLQCVRVAWAALSSEGDTKRRELTVFTLVAGALAVMQALSMGVSGQLTMPALGLVTCLSVAGCVSRFRKAWLASPFVILNAVAIVAPVALLHWEPYRFAGWVEFGRHTARARSELRELQGLELSSRTVKTVDGIVEALKKASDPGEPIFTYSVYPIFYWLADRPAASFASLQWPDVTPDRIVDRDMRTLLENPPVAIVWQHLTPFLLSDNEAYYRGGKESAVRRMNAALSELLLAKYQKLVALPSRADGRRGPPIEVWVRSDRAVERGLVIPP